MTKFLCGECIHNSDKGGGCLVPKNLGYVDNCNRYLPKDRPIVQTNEEYLKSCTTEQLAEFIIGERKGCVYADCPNGETPCMSCKDGCDIDKLVEWLKQPHNSPK